MHFSDDLGNIFECDQFVYINFYNTFRMIAISHYCNIHYAEATIITPLDKWLICLTK